MSEGGFAPLFPAAELAVGGMRGCELAGLALLVCRTRDGLFALDDLCTHAEARLSEGRLKGHRLQCPLHAGTFDVRDGSVLHPPAMRPLRTFPVRVRDGVVEVAAAGPPHLQGVLD